MAFNISTGDSGGGSYAGSGVQRFVQKVKDKAKNVNAKVKSKLPTVKKGNLTTGSYLRDGGSAVPYKVATPTNAWKDSQMLIKQPTKPSIPVNNLKDGGAVTSPKEINPVWHYPGTNVTPFGAPLNNAPVIPGNVNQGSATPSIGSQGTSPLGGTQYYSAPAPKPRASNVLDSSPVTQQTTASATPSGVQAPTRTPVSDVTESAEGNLLDGAINDIYGGLTDIKNRYSNIIAGADPEAKAIADQWYAAFSSSLINAIDQQIADLRAQGKEVDPQLSTKLAALRDSMAQEKEALNQTMNQRGLLQSGISLAALSRLSGDNMNKMAELTQWAASKQDEIMRKINALTQSKADKNTEALAQRDKMYQDYYNSRMDEANALQNQYNTGLSNYANMVRNVGNDRYKQQIDVRDYNTQQANTQWEQDMAERKQAEIERANKAAEGLSQQRVNAAGSAKKSSGSSSSGSASVDAQFVSAAVGSYMQAGYNLAQVSQSLDSWESQGQVSATEKAAIINALRQAGVK